MALLFCQNSKLLLICLTFSSRKDLSISPSCHVFHSCLSYLHRAPHRPSSAMTNFSPKFIYTTPHGALLCPLLPYLPILLLSPLPLLGVFISYAGHWRFKVSAIDTPEWFLKSQYIHRTFKLQFSPQKVKIVASNLDFNRLIFNHRKK